MSEAQLQTQIATYLHWALEAPYYFTAIGHGGGGRVRGAMLQGMGVKKGVLDTVILGPRRFVGWLEIKELKGCLTPEQIVFIAMVRAFGHQAEIARSLDEARAHLLAWRVPLRETHASLDRIRAGLANPGPLPPSDTIGSRKRLARPLDFR